MLGAVIERGAARVYAGCGKTLQAVILRSPDLIGTTKDPRSCLILKLPGFFAALKLAVIPSEARNLALL
jgi:hypothetical protein